MNPQLFQIILTLLGSILGSGAAVTLIKFFIERKDNKAKEAKQEAKEAEHDKFEELREELNHNINEKEKLSLERFTKHKDAITSLNESVNTITQNINRNSITLQLIGESLLGIEHDKIIFMTDKIACRKHITLKEKSTLEALYIPYAKLGGNGDCKIGYNHCIGLPVITDEEASQMDKEIQRKSLGL